MKLWLILIFIVIFANLKLDKDSCYNFTFYPAETKLDILEFSKSSVRFIDSTKFEFMFLDKKYTWKNKNKLYKESTLLGIYPLLQYEKCFEVNFKESL